MIIANIWECQGEAPSGSNWVFLHWSHSFKPRCQICFTNSVRPFWEFTQLFQPEWGLVGVQDKVHLKSVQDPCLAKRRPEFASALAIFPRRSKNEIALVWKIFGMWNLVAWINKERNHENNRILCICSLVNILIQFVCISTESLKSMLFPQVQLNKLIASGIPARSPILTSFGASASTGPTRIWILKTVFLFGLRQLAVCRSHSTCT